MSTVAGWAVFFFLVFMAVTLSTGPYNTEVVCFDKDGQVVFYASGYKPSEATHPLIPLSDGVYRVKKTGEKIFAQCKGTWGVNSPKGELYWRGKG